MTVLGVTREKDPDERLDYPVDFVSWLEEGDYIVSAVAEVGTGLTVVVDTVDVTSEAVILWIAGGTVPEDGIITCRATTNLGRVKEVGFRFRVRGS